MAFLGGYTDAEGNIGIYNNMARYRIGSYDKKILFSIHRRLKNYGMNAKIKLETKRGKHGNRIHNGDFWRVSLNNKSNLSKFFKLIKPYIKHRKRYNDLVTAEKNIIERDKLFH
jgi:RNA binding exosome subunit